MRRFVDLHLRPPDERELEPMLRLAKELRYSAIAFAPNQVPVDRVRELCRNLCIDPVSRIDLQPRSDRELTDSLSRLRRRFEVVAVECRSKAVARQAAKDHRVDILNFVPSISIRTKVWFDRQEASLASASNCAYEINASDLLRQGPTLTGKLLTIIREEVENAEKGDVPIIVSSGADSRLLMRDPLGLAALANLVDIDEEGGLNTISVNPWRIVEDNRAKLSPSFVVPGVRVVDQDAR